MSSYTKAVEACLMEVGQPLPDWGDMNSATFPGDPNDSDLACMWSKAIDKAIEICGHLYDIEIDGESNGRDQ